MEPKSVGELRRFLDGCDRQTRSEPTRSVDDARRAFSFLEKIEMSPYQRRKYRLWAEGVLGTALLATGQIGEAESVLEAARRSCSTPSTERATLAVRLTGLFAEKLEWAQALSEAEMAVTFFKAHRPRFESDIRSLAGALVARGNIALIAFTVGATLPIEACPARLAEIDYRAALRCCSANTEACVIAASANLCKIAIRLWWERGEYKIHPQAIAKDMKRVCGALSKQGIKLRSRPHANARWVYGLATIESYGGSISQEAESRLERAFNDLLDLGAMKDAACLALDLGYCFFRENRWDDTLTVISTLLNHPLAHELPPSWLQALSLLEQSIATHELQQVISSTFNLIRGISVTTPGEGIPIPRSRYGDRTDTLGF
jgi:hypothetical protein